MAILFKGIYGSIFFFSLKAFQDYNKTIGFLLFGVTVVLSVIFSLILSVKKKRVLYFLFLGHFIAAIIFLGIELYDNYFTNKAQLSDSIQHCFGWINPIYDSYTYTEHRVFGAFSIIFPIILLICNSIVFLYYFILGKRVSKKY